MALHELPPRRWSRGLATHLLCRAGFGGSPSDIERLYQRGLHGAVQDLVDHAAPSPLEEPDWVTHPEDRREMQRELRRLRDTDPEAVIRARQEQRRQDNQRLMTLREAWVTRMVATSSPLDEKMTLFWHGHFATSANKVRNPVMLWRQNALFRRLGLGNFGELVRAVSRDPAMIIWLDLQRSNPEHPNENFARELMELFTLGEGHYTEPDIGEAARAFTGYRIRVEDSTFRFVDRLHDDGYKQFFDIRGRLKGDDIIARILQERQCPLFICGKLWDFFAGVPAPPGVVEQMAWVLRTNDYELKPVLRNLFLSEAFYSRQVVGGQIKSPVQWVVQTLRALEIKGLPMRPVLLAMREMGQELFAPPSVKGWDGGRAWITTSSLLFRYNLAGFLVNPASIPEGREARWRRGFRRSRVNWSEVVPPEQRSDPRHVVHLIADRLFVTPLHDAEAEVFIDFLVARVSEPVDDATLSELAHLMMSTPQYQLA